MTLPLYGSANFAKGWPALAPTAVLRLRSPNLSEPTPKDVAIIRSLDDLTSATVRNFTAALLISDETSSPPSSNDLPRVLAVSSRYSYLAGGDVIGFNSNTLRFRTLWRNNSQHNSLLVTERCNNYCLMCSQPPKDVDDRRLLEEIRECLPLIDKQTKAFTFTGGEPLSDWEDFVEVVRLCRDTLPDTAVHVLSNGRAFSQAEVTNAWASLKHPNLMVGIPIYSSVAHVHDYVVQAAGAFDETVLGILRLKDKGQRVEVRVVLHALTAPTIAETCTWLARNLPFVDHVALMGMENTGFAIANNEELWIDPIDYAEGLAEGVERLDASGVNVSIYNLPRCVLPPVAWPFAIQSISDWKNGFVDDCVPCLEQSKCSGIFTSGRPKLSRGIKPFLPL